MKGLRKRVQLVLLVAVLSLAMMAITAEAAKVRITGTNQMGQTASRSILYPTDVPKHEMHQFFRTDNCIKSSDPDYVGAKHSVYEQVDRIGGKGSEKGYFVDTLKNGDQVWGDFEATYTMTPKEKGGFELTGNGKGSWNGGTGKFNNVKGSFTFGINVTPEGGTFDWDAAVEY